MKPSVKNIQDKKLIKTSKTHQASRQDSVFSYAVKRDAGSVILSQQETGFALSIKMEKLEETLRVTKFTLVGNTQLEYLSPELNDAAFLEIVVRALVTLFASAEQCDANEIFFILSQDDAYHLIDFKGFFDNADSLTTREGSKISFTVYNTPETRAFLEEKVETIKVKLKQELWRGQKTDLYLKDFLQNHPKGTRLPYCHVSISETTPDKGNVLSFPVCKNR